MNQSLDAYIEWIELMTFFPGYLFVFALAYLCVGSQQTHRGIGKIIMSMLPIAYALVATLYLGFVIKNWFYVFEWSAIKASVYQPVLRIWAILGIGCLIPYIYKRPLFSLLHSAVFFVILLRDMVKPASGNMYADLNRKNDIRIYLASIAINLGALFIIILLTFIISALKKRCQTRS